MNPDDPVCLCFHVTRRKVINFIRVQRPRRASQLSECFGAGTGCGWCRPWLQRLLEQHGDAGASDSAADLDQMTLEAYRQGRADYRRNQEDQDSES